MTLILEHVRAAALWQLVAWSLALNVVLFVASVALGELAVRLLARRRCCQPAAAVTGKEMALSATCVVLNAGVTVVGALLYQRGWIVVLTEFPLWRAVLDFVVLFFVMDLAMYLLHRVAHHRSIYPWVHRTHHDYENPRPLTLFVLNPFEVLGFGGLWLIVLLAYPVTWLGMTAYLALNLAFGTIGHLGVEPFPRDWASGPLGWIATSSFHAGHHGDRDHNYGFYTLLWDRLFGTAAALESACRAELSKPD
ncbi:MAG: C-5 sterol desaturase [Planctomycetaceae bacterium]|nr:C-5 sterol desaturase [Planctomycetaceae bacterium]